MQAFYYIDKPLKYSSFDVIRILKKKLNIKKIGHTWTLDPLATGGLLIAVWKYTKLIPYLEKSRKTYEFTLNFDWYSESLDLWTEIHYFDKKIIENFKKNYNFDKIKKIITQKFIWKYYQLPPKYSAKKINWKRAYNLARAWEDFELKKNLVEIYNLEVLDYCFPKLSLRVEVSAWTYIRSLARDIAREFSLVSSYVSFLRRTKISNLSVSLAQKLDNFDISKKIKEKEIFDKARFISLWKEILEKIDNWLKVKGNFNFTINKDLFVFDGEKITNIVYFDGEKLVPKRKI